MEIEDTPIRHLVDAGLHVRLDGGALRVGPPAMVTSELAAYIRANRQALVAALAPRTDNNVIADFAAWESAAAAEFIVSMEVPL